MNDRHDQHVALGRLSDREAEVLAAVARRLTNREIAAELFISVRTVESHVSALLRKLAVPDRKYLRDIAINAAGRGVVARPTTSFVGRSRELDIIARLLEDHVLVTLLGPGGCGKTRLAQQATESWRFEIRAVDLAAIEPTYVESALIDVLDLSIDSGLSLQSAARVALAGRSVLLFIDNCDHVVEAAGRAVTSLLEGASQLRVLATSRRALGLPSETVLRIDPLPLPTARDSHAVTASAAGRLFADRAASIHHDFEVNDVNAEHVALVCQSVDGLPLAVELAAACLRSLSIEELAAALAQRVELPEQVGRPPRHRTMQAALQWSWSLLNDEEAALLSRLAVLPGDVGLDEMRRLDPLNSPPVTDLLDALTRLVDQSMLMAHISSGSPTRYELLETIRAFALERVEEQEVALLRNAHARLQRGRLADATSSALAGDTWAYQGMPDRKKVMAALIWSAGRIPDVAQGLLLSICRRYELDPTRSMLEGVRSVVQTHAIPDDWPTPVLAWAGLFLNYLDLDLLAQCARLAADRADGPEDEALAYWALGFSHTYRGEAELALSHLADAAGLFADIGDEWMVAHCSMARGLAESDTADAVAAFKESLIGFLKVGAPWHANSARMALVRRALETGILVDQAETWLEASLAFSQEHGVRHDRAHVRLAQAQLEAAHGRTADTLDLGSASALAFREIGDLRCLGRALLLMSANEPFGGESIRLSSEALELAIMQRDRQAQAKALHSLSEAAAITGDLTLQARAIGAAASLTGESVDDAVPDEYSGLVLEGLAGGPSFVLSHV